MKFVLLIAILCSAALVALVVVVALYRHKKSSMGEARFIGELAQVQKNLTPQGSVLICGEMWRAESTDGAFITAPTQVRIVGTRGHLLIVTVDD